jgi:hypothetical protein
MRHHHMAPDMAPGSRHGSAVPGVAAGQRGAPFRDSPRFADVLPRMLSLYILKPFRGRA